MSAKLSNLVLKEYTKILKTGEFSDVEILVGEKQNTKTFHLHSLILKVCSPYFRSAFSDNWIIIENNIIKYQKPNISVKVFEILINYIYSGKLELAKNDIKTIIELLIAADELCLNELCSYIEKYLLNDKESLKSNFILILNTIEKYDQFTILSQFCKTSCRKDPSIVFRADDFVTIGQECFLEFLTKYSDSLKQIEVWNKLTEWAIAKSNNELPSDATMWTIDNITTFGTLIQPFISHINFQKVSSIDFITKIKPFKSIFDDKFYNKIVEDHCLNADLTSPQIVKYLDSQIINLRDASLICNWIKAMKKQKWEVTYDFDLLVRGSRDGFDKNIFHKYCDKKKPTVTIARVKNSNEILGGFNPCNWKSVAGFGEFISTEESFIFSLDKDNLENSIFSKVIDTEHTILTSRKRGPFFGHGNSDFELLYRDKLGQCSKNGYEKAIRQSNEYFEVDDYEVFKVIYR
ncbi:BTB-domain-containing protein [Rhizophagus irregularis]|nr:BTB-domain-containing protein [Rhizophagus irregularis]